jgi:glycosyltransferase involved in cell wall biosynthesis
MYSALWFNGMTSDRFKLPPPSHATTGWSLTEDMPQLPAAMPDGSPWPRISIVTPSFNQGQFIEETIRSVILQGYPNLEYIIIDGGSSDRSVEIIKKYEKHLSYWVSEKDQGQVDAINKGMQKVTGDIVNWLNADDYLWPDALEKIAHTWIAVDNKSCILCGSAYYLDDVTNELTESFVQSPSEKMLPMAPPYTGGIQASWFISKSVWQAMGGLNSDLTYTMETDLYYRCNVAGIPFYPVQNFLAVYRQHEHTKTLLGWQESIRFKKGFYFGWLSKIPADQRSQYRKRIRRTIFGFYKNSITRTDRLFLRLFKLILGITYYPEALFQPYHLRHFFSLLFR